MRLLAPDEMAPILETCRDGKSAFVIVVDHASPRIPRRLADLGLSPSELRRHIAWDIGALEVALRVSDELDAALVAQNYSRLVIDCNRRPNGPTSIPVIAESTEIPGNVGLSADDVTARYKEIYEPYHNHLTMLLNERIRTGRATILVGQHSMTNVLNGVRREMHAAVLYNGDHRFALALLHALRLDSGLIIGDNEPYSGRDNEGSYTVRSHAEALQLPRVEVEIRQDLILTKVGIAEWGRRITTALRRAEALFYQGDPLDSSGPSIL